MVAIYSHVALALLCGVPDMICDFDLNLGVFNLIHSLDCIKQFKFSVVLMVLVSSYDS